MLASASLIKSDQAMYYLAHPETGKKVTAQPDGSFLCEHDGSVCAAPQHRSGFGVQAVLGDSGCTAHRRWLSFVQPHLSVAVLLPCGFQLVYPLVTQWTAHLT